MGGYDMTTAETGKSSCGSRHRGCAATSAGGHLKLRKGGFLCHDGPVQSILREARKHDTVVQFVDRKRLDQMSVSGSHQGVIAYAAAYDYAEVDDILKAALEKNEAPFVILLDNIEDPHNLGAIIRTANLSGAHGVIVPKHRACL